MKRALKDKLGYGIWIVLLLLFSCNSASKNDAEVSVTKYTCPMHPQIITDKPGSCPICHMDLVPLKTHAGTNTINAGLEDLVKPANQLIISKIRTIKPTQGVRTATTQVQGVINYDANNWNIVSSRVGGRIERLYVKYNYQYVSKGQKLMDIYSPDLANAQQELLYLKNNGDKNLLEAAKNKLRLLGASNQQINTVLKTGKIDYTFSIYSPYEGYVAEPSISKSASASSYNSGTQITSEAGGTSMNEMEASNPSPSQVPEVQTNSPLQIREGQYVNSGQKLFDLVNASSVWAEFFAGSEQLNHLKPGTSIQISSLDNNRQQSFSKVRLIQPYYNEGSTFSLVRARINNSKKEWKVGQLIKVKTDADAKFGTWLPRTAVLQLGSRFIVFTKKDGTFVPAFITVKERRGDWLDIGNSLNKGIEVAVNAWFMVDSESFVRVDSLKN